jgi:hypothetical protein
MSRSITHGVIFLYSGRGMYASKAKILHGPARTTRRVVAMQYA